MPQIFLQKKQTKLQVHTGVTNISVVVFFLWFSSVVLVCIEKKYEYQSGHLQSD